MTAADKQHRWFVAGRPTAFAGGENERDWKLALRESVAPAGAERQTHVEFRFALPARAIRSLGVISTIS
jgi:hypothetical protein